MISNAKKTAVAYYVNTAATAIAGLIVNPLLLTSLGPAIFGAWKAIQRLLDVGSAANGGAIQSLKWVIAHRAKSSSDEDKRKDVGAALVVMACWTPILLAVTAAMVVVLPSLIRDVPPDEIGTIYLTGSILAVNIMFTTLAAVPNSVLVGTNQGFRSVNITTVVFVLSNTGMVIAAVHGFGITGMALALTSGTVINGLLTFLVLRRRVRWWGLVKPSREDVRRSSSFSGWILAWSFVNRLSLATEVIILSAFAGATFVSDYIFTSYAVVFALSVCQLTTSSLMPKLGSLVGNGEWLQAQMVARASRELTIALATGVGSLVILLNGPFVKVWAGSDQYMGQEVNFLMVMAFVQFAIIRTDAQIQDTGLDIRTKVLLGALMTGAAITLGGAAFAIFDSVSAMFIAIIATRIAGSIGFPLLANRVTRSSTWPYGRAAIGATILSISAVTAQFFDATNVLDLILLTVAASSLLIPAVLFTTLSAPIRRKLLSR